MLNCWNYIKIVSQNTKELEELVNNEIINDESIEIVKKGKKGIYLILLTNTNADISWVDYLARRYTSCWIKNEWNNENGKSGIYIKYQDTIKQLEWTDLNCIDENEYFE